MISTDDKKSDQICLWCGESTLGNTDREHIFPEAIGGKDKLAAHLVCKKCNHKLSFLDEALKREHPVMLDAFQADRNIKGKIRDKEDKIRKKKERTNISGKFEANSTSITRGNNGNINYINASFIVTSEYFVRSLHKCIANILCNSYGSGYVRKKYPKLLDFVKNGGDVHPWSYAISYPNLFIRPLMGEPRVLNRCSIKVNNKTHDVISFIHTSGIWIVGSSPYLLNPNLIETFSDSIIKQLADKKEPISKKPMTDFFGFEWDKGKRNYIGELKFLWIVKEIKGKPNDDFLYLLTRCKICGQTNPTGIVLPRDMIYRGNVNKAIRYSQNTWNHYTIADLKKLGFKIEKWDNKSLKEYMNQGISIPQENDVKNMKISNCKTNCINCNNLINFSADDCFI